MGIAGGAKESGFVPDRGGALRPLLDHVPSMLAHRERDLRCRFANRAYETGFETDPDRHVGTSLRDLPGPEMLALNEPFILAALSGEEQTLDRVEPGPNDLDRLNLASYRLDMIDRQVVDFIVSMTEVTRLKRTETDARSAIGSLECWR
jgi:PAS domain-containing protein